MFLYKVISHASYKIKYLQYGKMTILSQTYPCSLPDWISARSKSPALRCTKPYLSTIFWHCVPLPLPGPPVNKNSAWVFQKMHKKICPVTPKLLLGPDKFHNKALHCENLQWLNLWTSKLAKSIVHILLHGKNFSCLTKNIDYSCFFLRCQERGIITSSHFLHLYNIVNT